MTRRVLTLVALCFGLVALGATVAYAEPDPPPKCFRTSDAGELPSCTWDGQRWSVSYDDGFGDPGGFGLQDFGDSEGGGMPAGFGVLVVIVVLGGLATTFWRVSVARQMAEESGMDPGRATAMTLLSDDGLDATYIAASIRGPRADADDVTGVTHPAPETRTVEQRLRELQQLRDEGLVTQEEYDVRRTAILDSV